MLFAFGSLVFPFCVDRASSRTWQAYWTVWRVHIGYCPTAQSRMSMRVTREAVGTVT